MTLYQDADAESFRPDRTGQALMSDYLELDEVLSRGGNDLGIEIDSEDFLVLVEGSDFD